MASHPKAGNNDAGREVNAEVASETLFTDEKQMNYGIDEKTHGSSDDNIASSDSEDLQLYEVDNMARDSNGRLVVETSELAVTVIHVDDDPTLNPWTFRTFFLGTRF